MFVEPVFRGEITESIQPFFGAKLIALWKMYGGVWPITVGCTLQHLVAKVAGVKVIEDMSTLLAPCQMGYEVKNGAKAAIDVVIMYLGKLAPTSVILKLDFPKSIEFHSKI